MTITPDPTTATVAHGLDTAALIGVIELLVNPEFDNEWLTELLEDADAEVTEENRENLFANIIATNKVLAAPFILQLPDEKRWLYL